MINELKMNIWGRDFSLEIIYDCYGDESVTPNQIRAIDRFAKHPEWVEKSKETVEGYCHKQVAADETNEKKDNIFSYIKPEMLFVKRDKSKPRVALMCKYRYDVEHGLAIVFSSSGKATIGSQNIIL